MLKLSIAAQLCFFGGLGVACLLDLRDRRVPNALTAGLAGAGLLVRGLELGLGSIVPGLGGAVAGLALLFLPFHRGWVGGGDVKLLAAIGAWLGPLALLRAWLAAALLGGLLAGLYWLRSRPEERRTIGLNVRLSLAMGSVVAETDRPRQACPPYALALAGGALVQVLLLGGGHAL